MLLLPIWNIVHLWGTARLHPSIRPGPSVLFVQPPWCSPSCLLVWPIPAHPHGSPCFFSSAGLRSQWHLALFDHIACCCGFTGCFCWVFVCFQHCVLHFHLLTGILFILCWSFPSLVQLQWLIRLGLLLWFTPLVILRLIYPGLLPLRDWNSCLMCHIPALLCFTSPIPALIWACQAGVMLMLILPGISGCLCHPGEILLGAQLDTSYLIPQAFCGFDVKVLVFVVFLVSLLFTSGFHVASHPLSKGLEGPLQVALLSWVFGEEVVLFLSFEGLAGVHFACWGGHALPLWSPPGWSHKLQILLVIVLALILRLVVVKQRIGRRSICQWVSLR